MPLARGTAVVGGMFLQAVFLAADMPVTASIPKVLKVIRWMVKSVVI